MQSLTQRSHGVTPWLKGVILTEESTATKDPSLQFSGNGIQVRTVPSFLLYHASSAMSPFSPVFPYLRNTTEIITQKNKMLKASSSLRLEASKYRNLTLTKIQDTD